MSWLLQNCRKNPLRYLVCSTILKLRWRFRDGGILIAGAEAIYLSILADAGRDPEKPIEFYMQELSQWRELAEHWERKTRELITPARTRALGLDANNPFWEQIISQSGSYILSYALVRELKPKVIVETGTAYGHGTVYIAAAAFKNGDGRVISIDIPAKKGELKMNKTIGRKEIGSFIPEFIRSVWEYREGDAKVLLPRVLIEDDVEMFIHDSLHTATHMAFEYAVARALMRHKTLIVSDDIAMNNAFDNFLAGHKLTGYALAGNPNFGFVVNKFNDEERSIGTGIVTPD